MKRRKMKKMKKIGVDKIKVFRFFRAACFAHIKGSVGLILDKVSGMRISIPLDLSSRSFTPLFLTLHSFSVTFVVFHYTDTNI